MSNFYNFQANGDKDVEENPQPQETVVQDQDSVIGDAMCEAAHLIYTVAQTIANCINEDNQAAIPIDKLREAERAFCYMEGVVFGLAMDRPEEKWYMTELAKCLATIEQSKENGFQTQIYLPPVKPWDLLGYDEMKLRLSPDSMCFLRIRFRRPSEEYVKACKEELVKDPSCKYLFEKGILDPFDFPGAPLPEVVEPEVVEEKVVDVADKKVADDSSSVLNLRNLLRQNKIDKSQYIGGLATLVATGLISKSEFTRLKAAAS
jgi:hypothetical protein